MLRCSAGKELRLSGEGAKTHLRCVCCKKEPTPVGSRVMTQFLGKVSGVKGISLCVGGGIFRPSVVRGGKLCQAGVSVSLTVSVPVPCVCVGRFLCLCLCLCFIIARDLCHASVPMSVSVSVCEFIIASALYHAL